MRKNQCVQDVDGGMPTAGIYTYAMIIESGQLSWVWRIFRKLALVAAADCYTGFWH